MFRKTVSAIMLTLLLTSMLTLAFNIQPVKAEGTIYIRTDGSIDPPAAPIQRDGDLYTLVGNITSDTDGIVIERDDVILDGAGYSLQGSYMNSARGINLSMRHNVTVRYIDIEWFYEGIWLFESSYSNISCNNIANNGDGVLLHNSSNNVVSGNKIADIWTYGIISTGDQEDYSSNNIITGNNITGCNGVGIYFSMSTDSSIISDNNITANEGNGIGFYYSSQNNSINGNNIAGNWNWGIAFSCSPNNSINGNHVAGNGAGIFLSDRGTTVIGNTFVDDGLCVDALSHQNVVEDNTVNSKPLVYLENKSDVNVDYAGQVILVNCTNIKVENLDLSNTLIGVQLVKTNSSSISGNNITANNAASVHLSRSYGNSISGNNIAANDGNGIYLSNSFGNSISGNNINNMTTNGQYGIFLYYSSQNLIYHNNFANNFGQAYATPPDYANAWDDDYPSGGNYWSDYAGADLFSGEYQNETGSDGMWDHPRVIDLDNQDRYPLVTPWTLRPPPALEWNTTYGGMEFDDAVALVTTSDGGYALAGLTQSFGAESGDFWLVKTDYVGTVQWNRTYGGTNNYDELYGLVQTNDGGYVLVGYTNYPNGGLDAWLVKTDASGTMQWNQTYGGADSDMAFALVETTDGGYALAGMTLSFGVGNGDFWLVKIDANGGMQWNKTYGGTGGDQAYALVQTADGGYALAGYTRYLGGNDRDFWLVKTDSYGNAQWNRTYGGTNVDSAEALVETTDGGYALAGWTDSFGAGGWDAWLVKTDASGTMQWNQSYGGADIDEALALVETTDGGYALAGYTCSSGAGGPDAWLVRTDANGIEQWNQTYGGTDSDYAWALVQTADGGYALAGETWSFGAGDADAWLVKIDASGNLPVHNINTGLCYVTIQEAINAPETLDGHTIFVESGTYYENVILNKSIRLMGEGRSITSISSQEGVVVSVEANNVSLSGFTIETYGAEYGAEGVVIRSVNHCNVTGNTIRSCQVGLGLISSSYVEVIGNEIVDNEYALNIESSDYDNISENYVGSNINGGIYLCLSVSNTISNNTVTNSEFGVFIEESANNTFYGNIITANSNMGVDLWYSTNNTLKDNIMISNLYNFGVEGETLSHFTNDVDSSNTVDGKPIHYWTNQLNTAIPLDAGYVALVNCVDISVEGLTLKNNLQGLLLFSTMNSQMTNNIIANNCDGFRLCKSSNNTISGNNITEKEFGILLEESSDNEISCNNISGSMTSTNEIGIYAWDSSNNSIFGNNITNNWYDGIGLDSCSNNSVCDNNIVGSAGGIYVDGSFNTISGNHITGSDWSGIFMVGSNNSISGNIIANNRIGIDLLYSANNSVSRNSIVANYEFGVIFYGSSNNSIYHNDFIDNTAQARSIDSINDWDDGYLSGGNYWSDYTNADICSGPYQNETGSDGIGDTPCTIDAYNQDNYPLMGPWTGVGENVTITHASGVSLIFANVTSSGITTVNETQTGPDPPSRFKLATETPTYYDIKTTANYKGSIQIRIPYNDTGLTQGQENNLRLMHWNEIQQQWIDITTYVDTENNLIYGETSGLSMFSVMLSPNTAANNITFSRTVVSQGYSTTINVTIENQGGFAETFDFSLYANETIIESENVTLPAGNSTTITFTWNTTGFAYGNYTLSAYAWPVPDETNTADNNFTGGWVIVSLVGDITGPDGWPDGKCDMRDIGYVARRFMCKPGDPLWDPNADIDDNAKIDMKDIGTTARHFGEHLP